VDSNRFEAHLKKIGANVRQIRKSQGLTMEAVAHAAEIEYRQLGKIERGEGNITIISLLRIAEVLKVEINQFV
jgi:transcriptional regulator with XRE-family HTH domain